MLAWMQIPLNRFVFVYSGQITHSPARNCPVICYLSPKMHHTCYLSAPCRNATVQHEILPLPVAQGRRPVRNKKVVQEGNRWSVIVLLIGSARNRLRSLFCKLCLRSRSSCFGAILEPVLGTNFA